MRLPQTAREWFVATARNRIFGTAMPVPRVTNERSGRKYLMKELKGPTINAWYAPNDIFREGRAPGYKDEQMQKRRKKQAEFRAYVASGKKLKQSQIRKQSKSRSGRKNAPPTRKKK